MTLGQFLAAQTKDVTQRRIAELTGIYESRLSLYCNGLIPGPEHKAAIAAALRELCGFDGSIDDFWPAPEPEKV